MKTTKYLILLPVVVLIMLVGCRKYDDPKPIEPVTLVPTKTIAQFKALYTTANTPVIIDDPDMVIGGRITSTDRYGNFYRSMYIQDASGGIEIKIGTTGLYNTYKVGQWVYVKPDGLCLGKYRSLESVGYPSDDTSYETAYMNVKMLIGQTIFPGVWDYQTELDTLEVTSISDMAANVGKLVRVKNAPYESGQWRVSSTTGPLTTWAHPQTDPEANDSYYGEHKFNVPGSTDKVTFIVRTSGYANFAADEVNLAVGQTADLTGILTVYQSGAYTTYQLILNNDTNVEVVRH